MTDPAVGFDIWSIFWPALTPLLLFLPFVVLMRIALDRLEAKAARRARERRLGTLEERLERAGTGMQQARGLLDGVEAELSARQATLIRLTADAEQWALLAAIHQDEVKAVSGLVRHEVDQAGRRGLVQGTLVNAFFFALGFVVQALA